MQLFLRVTTAVNEMLRTKLRYRGDVSKIVDTALSETNLQTVHLLDEPKDRALKLVPRIKPATDKAVRAAARERGCTVSELANSALSKWLSSRAE